jgi:hypothetical protein
MKGRLLLISPAQEKKDLRMTVPAAVDVVVVAVGTGFKLTF